MFCLCGVVYFHSLLVPSLSFTFPSRQNGSPGGIVTMEAECILNALWVLVFHCLLRAFISGCSQSRHKWLVSDSPAVVLHRTPLLPLLVSQDSNWQERALRLRARSASGVPWCCSREIQIQISGRSTCLIRKPAAGYWGFRNYGLRVVKIEWSPFKGCSKSEYKHVYFFHCQELLPCPMFSLSSPFNSIFFSISSPYLFYCVTFGWHRYPCDPAE